MASEQTFREAYCEKMAIPTEDFAETVFWRCFPPQKLKLGRFFWWFYRDLFANDFELIEDVSESTTVEEVATELANFRSEVREQGFLRVNLNLRLSGQRLVDLASGVLPA